MAIYYIDNSLGDDQNSGLSPHSSWQSIRKLNGITFNPGDVILFKRGEIWNERFNIDSQLGTSEAPITFNAFGSGNLPLIDPVGETTGILVNLCNHIILRNLKIVIPWSGAHGYGMRILNNNNIEVDGCIVHGKHDETTKGIHLFESPNFAVRNCELSGVQYGIWLNSNTGFPGLISNNKITDVTKGDLSDWDGIKINGDDYTGLIIRRNDISEFSEDGIDLYSVKNVLVENNFIHDSSDSRPHDNQNGIKVNRECVVRYNWIQNIQKDNNQSRNGIGVRGDLTQVYYNVIVDVGSAGLLVLNQAQGVEVKNNTVISSYKGLKVFEGANAVAQNNILDGDSGDLLVHGSDSVVVGGSNLFVNDENPTVEDGGIYNGDIFHALPDFIDEESYNFHLLDTSPCRNAGVDVGLIRDYEGNDVPQETNPAIGAYEYLE